MSRHRASTPGWIPLIFVATVVLIGVGFLVAGLASVRLGEDRPTPVPTVTVRPAPAPTVTITQSYLIYVSPEPEQ